MPKIITADSEMVCFQAIGGAQIDAAKGTLSGVSVMSKGPALGHDLEVDDTSLDQIVRQGNQRDRVPVYLHHGSGMVEHVGDAMNFRRDGDKARADIELYDSHAQRAFVLEKAGKNPSSFGISSESYPGPKDPLHPLKSPNGKVRLLRSTKLDALAFVRDPATNTSLFSQPNPEDIDTMDKTELAAVFAEALKPVTEKLTALETENKALKTQLSALPDEAKRRVELEEAASAGATKFAATCGIKPGSVPVVLNDGKQTPDPVKADKTEFEKLVDVKAAAKEANPFEAARFENPKAFNEYMNLQRREQRSFPGR